MPLNSRGVRSRFEKEATKARIASIRFISRYKVTECNEFTGRTKVDFVENVLELLLGTIRARTIFENLSWFLTPRVLCRLRLFDREAEMLLIPDDAIASGQVHKIVMTLNGDNRVEVRIVELGPVSRSLSVVRKGLGVDDRLVFTPVFDLVSRDFAGRSRSRC